MGNKHIKNISSVGVNPRGRYAPAKKIDLGDYYLIYLSGVQAPKDENQKIVTDNIETQTELVFEEIIQILQRAGATIDEVVKAVIYITDMHDFDKISEIRNKYFGNAMPVSTLVEVNKMTRVGAKIEIEVTAMVKK
ncbi:MAG: RidA family protein [Candidatus Saccharimonadales bacterium]